MKWQIWLFFVARMFHLETPEVTNKYTLLFLFCIREAHVYPGLKHLENTFSKLRDQRDNLENGKRGDLPFHEGDSFVYS